MTVFELIHLVLKLTFLRHAPINKLKFFKVTVFFVSNLFPVQLKQENTKYSCFTAGP